MSVSTRGGWTVNVIPFKTEEPYLVQRNGAPLYACTHAYSQARNCNCRLWQDPGDLAHASLTKWRGSKKRHALFIDESLGFFRLASDQPLPPPLLTITTTSTTVAKVEIISLPACSQAGNCNCRLPQDLGACQFDRNDMRCLRPCYTRQFFLQLVSQQTLRDKLQERFHV